MFTLARKLAPFRSGVKILPRSMVQALHTEISEQERIIQSLELGIREREDTVREREQEIAQRDEMILERQEQITRRDALVREREGDIVHRDALVREREGDIVHRDALVREREDEITNRDALVREREGDIVHRDALVRERESEIGHRDVLIREREGLLIEREARIATLASREQRSSGGVHVTPLGRDTVLVRLNFGGHMVVPTWNMDVGAGLVREGIIEPWTSRLVEALVRPGETMVNAGANLGYYMVLGAHRVDRAGQVIAIEANPHLLPYLLRTIHWCGHPETIRLFNCAVGDVDDQVLDLRFDPQYMGGTSVISPADPADAVIETDRLEDALWENADLSSLFRQSTGEWRKGAGLRLGGQCRTKRLDTILGDIPEVHMLLMDIEGSEPAAILGGQELVRRSRQMSIIMEWSPYYCLRPDNLAQTDEMVGFLESEGFHFYRVVHEGFEQDQCVPALARIADKQALYGTQHNDVLCTRNLEAALAGRAAA